MLLQQHRPSQARNETAKGKNRPCTPERIMQQNGGGKDWNVSNGDGSSSLSRNGLAHLGNWGPGRFFDAPRNHRSWRPLFYCDSGPESPTSHWSTEVSVMPSLKQGADAPLRTPQTPSDPFNSPRGLRYRAGCVPSVTVRFATRHRDATAPDRIIVGKTVNPSQSSNYQHPCLMLMSIRGARESTAWGQWQCHDELDKYCPSLP